MIDKEVEHSDQPNAEVTLDPNANIATTMEVGAVEKQGNLVANSQNSSKEVEPCLNQIASEEGDGLRPSEHTNVVDS